MNEPKKIVRCEPEFDEPLTWRVLKDAIDKMIADNGLSPDIKIHYFDFTDGYSLVICYDEMYGLTVQ